jgi:predicted transcriptional regulator
MLRTAWRGIRQRRDDLAAFFGRLELRTLEALWRRGGAASVRDVQAEFPGTAYTTVMTTLDRLHRKGVLERRKEGRAFFYRPRYTREELRLGLVRDALGDMLSSGADAPLLSCLVEAVSETDQSLLDELERLVAEKRRALANVERREK